MGRKIVCPFCGIGCNLEIILENSTPTRTVVRANPSVNLRYACAKGLLTHKLLNHPDRLKKPLLRSSLEEDFREVSWSEALEITTQKLSEIVEKYGANAIAIICSGKILNEEAYLVQKFARTVLHTNNVDTCARLCHASSEVVLKSMLGYGSATVPLRDLDKADTIMIVGANPKTCHPVLWNLIKKNKRAVKLIVDAGLEEPAFDDFDIFLKPRPGTDFAWISGLARVIYEEGLYDFEFVKERTLGFEEFITSLKEYTSSYVEEVSGISWRRLRELVDFVRAGRRTIFIWGMGLTQYFHGTINVAALVNLALLTGNIGKPGSGLLPLRGQNNIQGVSDMGVSPYSLPGGYMLSDELARRKFEEAWGTKLPKEAGIPRSEILQEIMNGKIKALYVIGSNPALSDPQDSRKCFAKIAIQKLDLLIVQDIFMTETAKLAHVIFPAAMIGEKEGTLINAERRIQLTEKIIDPPGEALEDWKIILELAKRMGADWDYKSSEDIWNEIRRLISIFSGANYQRLKESNGLSWPIKPDGSDTPRLYVDGFPTPSKKAKFIPIRPPTNLIRPMKDYPILLITSRSLDHFNTGEMTRRINLNSDSMEVILSGADARKLDIRDGDLVRIISPYGSMEMPVKVDSSGIIPSGIARAYIHFFREYNLNKLIGGWEIDEKSKTPMLKTVQIRIEKND